MIIFEETDTLRDHMTELTMLLMKKCMRPYVNALSVYLATY